MVLLRNEPVDGAAVLPLRPGLKVYIEGLPAEDADRLGEIVEDPAAADVAVIRLPAPFDIRDDLFLEGAFHQGSLEYRPGLVARLRDIAAATPLVIVANLERPAILTPFVEFASAILADVGASPAACVDVLTGATSPRGRLPFEIPRSTAAVRDSRIRRGQRHRGPALPARGGTELLTAHRRSALQQRIRLLRWRSRSGRTARYGHGGLDNRAGAGIRRTPDG